MPVAPIRSLEGPSVILDTAHDYTCASLDSRPDSPPTTVAMVTLGCARNEVDSEELAGRLEAGGFRLVEDPEAAETVVVNTCGFVEAAKKDSVDTLLAAADLKDSGDSARAVQAVVAVGCLAERYGAELATSLPGGGRRPRLRRLPRHRRPAALDPGRRGSSTRTRPRTGASCCRSPRPSGPTHRRTSPGTARDDQRRRLDAGPMAPLKLASGCDRRCTFCAIPAFRGSFVSRRPSDVLAEARWLADQGARELFLVSENSTSYGKDLGDLRLLETLLPELAAVDGVERVRVSYLQPAETRPGLVTAIASTPGVAAYFDLSFQHASNPVLRRMRRFGDSEAFLGLLDQARAQAPEAGARSNFIVGFPGETEHDLEVLCDFLGAARLDAIGIFGYSDEDGTEAEGFDGQARRGRDPRAGRARHGPGRGADRAAGRGAHRRAGRRTRGVGRRTGVVEGRAAHQGPEVDGSTTVQGVPDGVRGR